MNIMRTACSLSILISFGFFCYEHLSKDDWGIHAYVAISGIALAVIMFAHAILTYEEDDSENDE
ncbi:hypothetical protein [Thaumasiovibrio subtropicus]|uniref:hypothetical protein n=1 Tax=Thaumasiovibrio subtropicus TaxID=1891207 RepID=UPI00131E9E9A|nr:hypothetical protein [Thaumasiovibrio subtropicus]